MTNQNNGGPAFPRSESLYPDGTVSDPGALGATLRDYFAAKAVQGMLSAGENYSTSELAMYGYEVADAMLKAREGGAA